MTPADVVIRLATREDLREVNRIYNHFVVGTHVSFDIEPWTDTERVEWFEDRVASGHTVFVAVKRGVVVGAAWSGPWRSKVAYARSVETTVVVDHAEHRSGIGTLVYGELLSSLQESGVHRAYAVIALPNETSLNLHHRFGFTEVGRLDEVGYKDGRYVSTMLLECRLEFVDSRHPTADRREPIR